MRRFALLAGLGVLVACSGSSPRAAIVAEAGAADDGGVETSVGAGGALRRFSVRFDSGAGAGGEGGSAGAAGGGGGVSVDAGAAESKPETAVEVAVEATAEAVSEVSTDVGSADNKGDSVADASTEPGVDLSTELAPDAGKVCAQGAPCAGTYDRCVAPCVNGYALNCACGPALVWSCGYPSSC